MSRNGPGLRLVTWRSCKGQPWSAPGGNTGVRFLNHSDAGATNCIRPLRLGRDLFRGGSGVPDPQLARHQTGREAQKHPRYYVADEMPVAYDQQQGSQYKQT
jgi:hypothetical protein